jgi:hypothetical protein
MSGRRTEKSYAALDQVAIRAGAIVVTNPIQIGKASRDQLRYHRLMAGESELEIAEKERWRLVGRGKALDSRGRETRV